MSAAGYVLRARRVPHGVILLKGLAVWLLATWLGASRCCGAGASPRLFTTNGAAVFEQTFSYRTQLVHRPRVYQPPPADLPVEIRRAMLQFLVPQQSDLAVQTVTNLAFHHFVPESLNYVVWTNLLAHTNGKNTAVWRMRTHPQGWPAKAPELAWNRSSLVWGLRGMTALSPCWEGEGSTGQVPITALTPRHGYTRGHDMGPNGFRRNFAGKKVWFVTKDDRVVERTILREVVRTTYVIPFVDYTIVLFNKELPADIQPMRVSRPEDVAWTGRSRYHAAIGSPLLLMMTEQTGQVGVDLPGFRVEVRKGGDSGSPNMLPLPGELVFVNGRSTTGATESMQADMDELCRQEGLNPSRYRLRWVDLERFPYYRY